eukprot:353394-Chlamydomonas_euryale.AAC.10
MAGPSTHACPPEGRLQNVCVPLRTWQGTRPRTCSACETICCAHADLLTCSSCACSSGDRNSSSAGRSGTSGSGTPGAASRTAAPSGALWRSPGLTAALPRAGAAYASIECSMASMEGRERGWGGGGVKQERSWEKQGGGCNGNRVGGRGEGGAQQARNGKLKGRGADHGGGGCGEVMYVRELPTSAGKLLTVQWDGWGSGTPAARTCLQQREEPSLPEAVAAVRKLVGATIEAALHRRLALRRPPRERRNVDRAHLAGQSKRREPAKGVAAMRFGARFAAEAALVRLRAHMHGANAFSFCCMHGRAYRCRSCPRRGRPCKSIRARAHGGNASLLSRAWEGAVIATQAALVCLRRRAHKAWHAHARHAEACPGAACPSAAHVGTLIWQHRAYTPRGGLT